MEVDEVINSAQGNATASSEQRYSVEFFHIYTDEEIGSVHEASVHYLKEAQKAWKFNNGLIVLIDNYNPTKHTLREEDVFHYLNEQGVSPVFWAYEADLIDNAKQLLESITSPKLQRSYSNYVEKNKKYPCSLLTATWYLTRLGVLPTQVIKARNGQEYVPADRLINILPQDYEKIEVKALELIQKSEYSQQVHHIQDLFFPMSSGRQDLLW